MTGLSVAVIPVALLACACFGAGFSAGPRLAPSEFAEKIRNDTAEHWLDRWRLFQREPIRRSDRPTIVFLGDSLTEHFPADALEAALPGWAVVNRGISGDKIGGWKYYGVRDRLDVSLAGPGGGPELDAAYLMIGINDIIFAQTPAELMVEHYALLLAELRAAAPEADLYVSAVLPVRGRYAGHAGAIDAFNAEIERLAARAGARWVDPRRAMSDAEGMLRAEMTGDDLHFTAEGYRALAGVIGAAVRQP